MHHSCTITFLYATVIYKISSRIHVIYIYMSYQELSESYAKAFDWNFVLFVIVHLL